MNCIYNNQEIDFKGINKGVKVISSFLKSINDPKVIIGESSNLKNDFDLSRIISTFIKNGISVDFIGNCTEGELAFITHKHYSIGLYISLDAEKILIKTYNKDAEFDFTHLVFSKLKSKHKYFPKLIFKEDLKKEYESYLKTLMFLKCNNLLIECEDADLKNILKKIYPNSKILTKGKLKSGAINDLQKKCLKTKKIGLYFCNNCLNIVDFNGNIIDEPKIVYLLTMFYLKKNDRIVANIDIDLGLEISTRKMQVGLTRAKDDLEIINYLKTNGFKLGISKNGYVYFPKYYTNVDPIMLSVLVMNMTTRTNMSFTDLLSGYVNYKRKKFYTNVNVLDYENMEANGLLTAIKDEDFGIKVSTYYDEKDEVLEFVLEGKNESLIEDRTVEICKKLNYYIRGKNE